MKVMRIKINGEALFLTFFAVFFTALLGSFLTYTAVNSEWYTSVKTSITPPNFVFPIVWTIIFLMIFFSFYFSLVSVEEKSKLKLEMTFMLNLFLNVFWTFLYFFFKRPDFAFFELIALWLSIIGLIFMTSRIDKKSAWLLIPYLLWVTFAGILNYLSAFK